MVSFLPIIVHTFAVTLSLTIFAKLCLIFLFVVFASIPLCPGLLCPGEDRKKITVDFETVSNLSIQRTKMVFFSSEHLSSRSSTLEKAVSLQRTCLPKETSQ